MYIKRIEWIDKEEKEAILKVSCNKKNIVCFAYPCLYNVGDILNDPLECLDCHEIIECDEARYSIEKLEGKFKYRLKGKIKDIQNGIMEVYGFDIHIDRSRVPGDIINGMYVQLVTSRIDIW